MSINDTKVATAQKTGIRWLNEGLGITITHSINRPLTISPLPWWYTSRGATSFLLMERQPRRKPKQPVVLGMAVTRK